MLQFARQHSFVELVEVDQLNQIREFGVPVVQSEEGLPFVLELEGHKKTLAKLEDKMLWRTWAHGE